MSDALRLARAQSDDDDALSPLCKSILDGTHQTIRKRDDRADEIAALTKRVAQLEANDAKRKPSRRMEKADMELLSSAIGNVLGEAIEPLHKRIEQLEKRSAPVWRGTWHAGMDVEPGSFVTDKGGLWLAVEQSNGTRPGECSAFRLVCKNGAHSDNGTRRHAATGVRN